MGIAPAQVIVVPGRGVVNLDAERVNRAVQEYDERLRFGFNEANGDWIAFIRMPRGFEAAYFIEGEPAYPVMGFGNRIPSVDEALSRIRASDSMREGDRILTRINSENERQLKALRALEDEAIEETAERMEHALRTEGETDKYTKVFMPGD